jgi:hypothetical protein
MGGVISKARMFTFGVKLFDHYKMALQYIHGYYIQQRVSEECLFDLHIWSCDHKTLAHVVKGRCLEISTAAFHEKMGTDATPYTQIDLIPKKRTVSLDNEELSP